MGRCTTSALRPAPPHRRLTHPDREMARRDARHGLETMCLGGGQYLTAIFEKV